MSKIKVYSVRLKSLTDISDKAYLAEDFNANKAIIPKSQVYESDLSALKSQAYWISAWILEKKSLQYSTKKVGWYNTQFGKIEPNITILKEIITPERIQAIESEPDESLIRRSEERNK